MTLSVTNPRAQLNHVLPNINGATTAVNNVGTAGAQVIALDPTRKTIIFHNPNMVANVNLMVYQMQDANGNTLTPPTFAAPGGGWIIVPGGTLTFSGDIQGAWGAVAQSGSANGLSIISSRT